MAVLFLHSALHTFARIGSFLPRAMGLMGAMAAMVAFTGCSTLTNERTQKILVQTLDEKGKPIELRCRASHGPAEYFGNSPLIDLEVRRSSTDLLIECRSGDRIARATAISRGTNPITAMLPMGSTSLIIDHMTGYSYSYPGWIQLQLGQTLIFDADTRVAGRPTPGVQAEAR